VAGSLLTSRRSWAATTSSPRSASGSGASTTCSSRRGRRRSCRRRSPRRSSAALLSFRSGALAIAAFGTGYFVGSSGDSDEPDFVLPMSGSGASASLAVYPIDEAGNWPMKMTIRGLPPLPAGQRYELWLTKHGRLAASCGRFVVAEGRTIVALNAPYRLRAFDGWVITKAGSDEPLLHTT
jgi:hypothetical protein